MLYVFFFKVTKILKVINIVNTWITYPKYLSTVKNSSITTKHLYLTLTFRSHQEIFVRRSWYSVLPSLILSL